MRNSTVLCALVLCFLAARPFVARAQSGPFIPSAGFASGVAGAYGRINLERYQRGLAASARRITPDSLQILVQRDTNQSTLAFRRRMTPVGASATRSDSEPVVVVCPMPVAHPATGARTRMPVLSAQGVVEDVGTLPTIERRCENPLARPSAH